MKKIVFVAMGVALFCTAANAVIPALVIGVETVAGFALRAAVSRGAANAAVYSAERVAMSNVTKIAINQSVAKISASTGSRLKMASGVASWALIGDSLLKIGGEIFGSDPNAGISSASSISAIDNGRKFFSGAGKGGSTPYFSGDEHAGLVAAVYQYRADNGILYCPSGAKCTHSPDFSVTATRVSGGLTDYTVRYGFSYQQSSGTLKTDFVSEVISVQQNKNYSPEITPTAPDITPEQQQQLQKTALNAQSLADTLNALLLDAASQTDYAGIPVTSSNPLISARDILDAASAVGRPNPTQAEWTAPWSDLQPETQPQLEPNPQPQPEPETPPIPPELESPPDGKAVLSPLIGAFPEWENFSIGARSAQCPVAEFTIWDENFVLDSHCELIEKNRELIKLFCLICWGFASFRRVMSA
ncbi:hypothetical protein F157LOC_01021 [Pectobacterium brasiliense]|uniref:hypothetical protein n=1 Tax=Pectobacterium brasiliense TaxID=180957 RepID=UPI000CE69376|nr:hypothetical protein [Pectobacterium brasiliense]PPE62183.1 hypothetical protein F157LOC_01021 [Pectobacterium brasiliense]